MNRVREYRILRGLSQIELFQLSGIAQATISNIESGNRNASPLTRARLAKVLGCSEDILFPDHGAAGRVVEADVQRQPGESALAMGKLLRQMRVQRNMSQIELSNISGVAQATISNLESGNREASPLTVKSSARALKCEPEELDPSIWQSKSKRRSAVARTLRPAGSHLPSPLRDARVASGRSIEDLATATGISIDRLNRYEEELASPTPPERKLLAILLNRLESHLFPDLSALRTVAPAVSEVSGEVLPELKRLLRGADED